MNPKDMTNEALPDAWLKEMKGDYEHGCPCESEVQSRLNERDVLRKENEELRDALIDARSWMDAGMFEDVPPQYTAMVANVDAMLSKESEASHVATKG